MGGSGKARGAVVTAWLRHDWLTAVSNWSLAITELISLTGSQSILKASLHILQRFLQQMYGH